MSEQSSSYRFDFVVRASTWDEVIELFKNELGITKKRNTSDREINGLYLVSVDLNEPELTKDFYNKVETSNTLAIHSDEKSTELYPKILKETQLVEERLRWLLLHVSDAIEDYAKLLGFEKSDLVEHEKFDPLTSRLSFEAILDLLELDQSWARDGIDDERMRLLINDSTDFDAFKKSYIKKTTPKTVWKSISELVLDRPVTWLTLAPKLKSIKGLRNKCAHFHTVTDDDFNQARHLRVQIMRSLTKKSATRSNATTFMQLNKQLADTMKNLAKSSIIPPTALQTLASLHTEAFTGSQAAVQHLIESGTLGSSFTFTQNIAKEAARSMLETTAIYTSSPAFKAIIEAQKSILQLKVHPSSGVGKEINTNKEEEKS